MRVVGMASGIEIHAPDDAYFSYFNSPYISHSQGSSIDIYPFHQLWSGEVVSPVSGKIVKIREMKMGRPKSFPTEDFDFAIGIRPEESPNTIVRVMHCKPGVNAGESVDKGDSIGTTLRSRYFNYWTGPHYHVEIMDEDSFLRSSKSYPFERTIDLGALQESGLNKQSSDFELEVSSVTKDFVKVFSKDFTAVTIGHLTGLAAMDSNGLVQGILDGGISHYKHGGIVGESGIECGYEVYLGNVPIGRMYDSNRFLRGPSCVAYLNSQRIKGISCFVYPGLYSRRGQQPIVLVPQYYGQFRDTLAEGDIAILKIAGESNTVKAP
ncbi:MAG: hypothetical protein ACFFCP_12925 [Promethearchaeota archaeon]